MPGVCGLKEFVTAKPPNSKNCDSTAGKTSKKTGGPAVKAKKAAEGPPNNDQRRRRYDDAAQSQYMLRVVLRGQMEGSQDSWPQHVEEDSGQAGIE